MAKDDSYSDLIAEGLDELNAQENFDATNLKKEERRPKHKKSALARYGLPLGLCVLGLNLLVSIYFAASSESSKTREEADSELQNAYANEPAFEAVAPVLSAPPAEGSSPASAELAAQIDAIRASLPEQLRNAWPESADFIPNGSGFTYSGTEDPALKTQR